MTTEIEKQFFDTFGIEPIEFKSCDVGTFCPYEGQLCDDTCPYYRTYKVDYPVISDRILLELICIVNEAYLEFEGTDVETMKNSILDVLIFFKKDIDKQQVQELFKGVEDGNI